jgi:hypothetical protein
MTIHTFPTLYGHSTHGVVKVWQIRVERHDDRTADWTTLGMIEQYMNELEQQTPAPPAFTPIVTITEEH